MACGDAVYLPECAHKQPLQQEFAMYKDLKFPILIVHSDIKADTVAGDRVRAIAHELEQEGFSILSTASSAEGRIVASTHHGLACILVSAEGAVSLSARAKL